MAWEIVRAWSIGDAIGAVIVPPLLVPLLIELFSKTDRLNQTDWTWPSINNLLIQLFTILISMAVAFLIPKFNPDISGLWYVILLPPVFFCFARWFAIRRDQRIPDNYAGTAGSLLFDL